MHHCPWQPLLSTHALQLAGVVGISCPARTSQACRPQHMGQTELCEAAALGNCSHDDDVLNTSGGQVHNASWGEGEDVAQQLPIGKTQSERIGRAIAKARYPDSIWAHGQLR